MTIGALTPNPKFQGFDGYGAPLSGGKLHTYLTGTSTPKSTYPTKADAEAATNANANPVVLDSRGEADVWLTDDALYRFTLVTSADAAVWGPKEGIGSLVAAVPAASAIDYTHIGTGMVERDQADKNDDSVSLFDAGVVVNSAGAATANTTAVKKLISPAATGGTYEYSGEVDLARGGTYYFNGLVDIKPGIRIKGNDATFHFSKTYAAADDARGFLTFIRNVTIEDLNIVIDYDGTGGTNAGAALQIGTRGGYPYGEYTAGADDEDLVAAPQGGIVLRNVRITTNNPVGHIVLMLGGLDGVIIENLFLNGQNVAIYGLYYEFGFWHTGAAAADHLSSHMRNAQFTNIHIEGLDTSAGFSAFALIGAYGAKVSGLYVDGAKVGLEVRAGEALYYAMGTGDAGIKPHVSVENLNFINVDSGTVFTGAELASGGYLAAVIAALAAAAEYAAQTDLISLSVDGFSVDATGVAFNMDGPFSLKNGSAHGTASSGQLIITDEAFPFSVDNVRLTGSTNAGVRANIGNAIWSPARLKIGEIRSSTIAGNLTGLTIANSESVLISRCRIGYDLTYDPVAETTQIYGVQVTSTGKGVVADSCFVSVSAGGTPYRLEGTGPRGCALRNQRGTMSSTGSWDKNGIGFATTAEIADKTSFVNVECKWPYRMVWDTGNNRIMVTEGSTDVSPWIAADGSVVVTPV